jgi:dTDP-4-amino-4,6-dideoxygalactose transaminase
LLIVPAKPFDKFTIKEKLVDDAYQGIGHTAFFTLGRYALLYVLEYYDIRRSDKVLCPAYCCRSALEPLLNTGYQISFIDVTSNLKINSAFLIQQIEQEHIKAVILPEYFGLFDTISETIYNECKRRGIIVVKDSAHSYPSYLYDYKKKLYDAVILSMRKSVNVHYGGVAVFSNDSISDKCTLQESTISKTSFALMKWTEHTAVWCGINIYGDFFAKVRKLLASEKQRKINKIENTSAYAINGVDAKYLLNRNYYSIEVASARRTNFEKLRDLLKTSGITSPPVVLDDKVPQVYLVYGGMGLCTYLRNRGVGATMWPFDDIPDYIKKNIALYPNTGHFLQNLVCLPLHQGLSERQIKKMSELIHKYVAIKQ